MQNLIVCAALFLMSGCNPSPDPTPSNQPKFIWKTVLSETGLSYSFQPVLYNDRVIYSIQEMGRTKMPIVAYDKKAGNKLFTWEDSKNNQSTHNSYCYNNLMTIATGPRVYTIDLDNGTTKWASNDKETGKPEIAGIGKTIFHSNGENFVGIWNAYEYLSTADVTQGKWKIVFSDTLKNDFYPILDNPTPFVNGQGDTLLYVTGDNYKVAGYVSNSKMVCYNMTQKKKVFDIKFKDFMNLGTGLGFGGVKPIVYENKVYCVLGNNVFCFNATTGEKMWHRPYDQGCVNLLVEDGRVYYINQYAGTTCFDATTGTTIWNDPKGAALSSSIATLNGVLYFMDIKGKFTGLETKDGTTIFTIESPDYKNDKNLFFQNRFTIDKPNKRIYAASFKNAMCFEAIR
jgi:outer membrane protein assembly factor BamB